MNYKKTERDFLAYLHSHLDDSAEFYSLISRTLNIRKLNKNEVIFKEGEVCKEAFWLQSGYGRYFQITVDEDGFTREETKEFCKPGKIVFGRGFFDETPSPFNFELAAGAVIVPFTKACYEFLKMKEPEVATIATKILDLEATDGINNKNMMKMKPRERYREFLGVFGIDIQQHFAVKHIANNLGLQPSYLSRLRGEYHKKKTGLIKYLQTVFFILHFI